MISCQFLPMRLTFLRRRPASAAVPVRVPAFDCRGLAARAVGSRTNPDGGSPDPCAPVSRPTSSVRCCRCRGTGTPPSRLRQKQAVTVVPQSPQDCDARDPVARDPRGVADRAIAGNSAFIHPDECSKAGVVVDEQQSPLASKNLYTVVPVVRGTPGSGQRNRRKSTVADCFRLGRRRLNTDLVLPIVQTLHPDAGHVTQWRQVLRVVGRETCYAACDLTSGVALLTATGQRNCWPRRSAQGGSGPGGGPPETRQRASPLLRARGRKSR